jgi:hypothetical protein
MRVSSSGHEEGASFDVRLDGCRAFAQALGWGAVAESEEPAKEATRRDRAG